MSRFLGPIRQNGYVVSDIERAMDHWSRVLGVGPFFYVEQAPIKNYRYRGDAFECHLSVAFANSGPLQIELIQPRNDVPSMYRDFMRAGHSGLQHVAYWTTSYDADLARLASQGFKPVMSGEAGEHGRFVYFDTEYHPGTVTELSEISGRKGEIYRLIREASESWDGRDPIRPFPSLATPSSPSKA